MINHMRTIISGASLLTIALGGCIAIGIGLDQWRQGICVEGCDTVISGAHTAYAGAILPPLYVAMSVVFVLAAAAVRRRDGYRCAVAALCLSAVPAVVGLIVIAVGLAVITGSPNPF